MTQSQRYATKQKKTEHFGVGTLVQVPGFLLLFFFPLGTIAGVILLIIGSRMAQTHKCSECAGKVEKDARICRHCGAEF